MTGKVVEFLLGGALVWVVAFGSLGAWIADQKGRSPIEGGLLGLLLGPLGALIEALLPAPRTPADQGEEE